MKRKSFVLFTMLVSIIIYLFFFVPIKGFAQNNPDLQFFVDKDKVLEGESINIIVWVDSTKYSEAKISIIYPSNNFSLSDAPDRQLSATNNFQTTYVFSAKKSGAVNLLLLAELTDIKGTISKENLKIANITIDANPPWYSVIDYSTLVGVALGAILSFTTSIITTAISDARGEKKEKRGKNEWIYSAFTAQLEITRALIAKENEAKYEQWYQPLVNQGYLTELEKITPGFERTIAEIVVDIQEYEQKRVKQKIDKESKQKLIQRLEELIRMIQN